jgi:hypothetical protein
MSDQQPPPGPPGWGPPPPSGQPTPPGWVPPPPPAQPPSWDPPPGATIQQPPARKPRSWLTWVIALAAFGGGLAIGSAGSDGDTVTRKVFTENCKELPYDAGRISCEQVIAQAKAFRDAEDRAATALSASTTTPPTTARPKPTSPPAPTLTDGVYEVGAEIKAGIYKTRAPEGDDCYWARLADPDGDNILANHVGTGPMTLRVRSSDKFVELSGGCEWRKVG